MLYLIVGKRSSAYGCVVSGEPLGGYIKVVVDGKRRIVVKKNCRPVNKFVFGVGDEVKGLPTSDDKYYITNSDFTGEVLQIRDGGMLVRGKNHNPKREQYNMFRSEVECEYFAVTKVAERNIPNFLAAQGVGVVDWDNIPEPVEPPKPVEPIKVGGFSVGDEVRISEDSVFNDGSPINPANTIGTVTEITKGKLPLAVKWANELLNAYRPEDLVKG